MTLDEMKTRVSAIDEELAGIVTQLQDESEERANTEELETRSNELLEERQTVLAEIEKAEKAIEEEKRAMADVIANNKTEVIEKREEPKMTDMEIRNSQNYIDAYAEYIKTGDDAECRALLTENGSGTIAVPELVYDIVKTAWDKNEITKRVKRVYFGGNLKINFEISGDAAVIPGEGEAASEESLVEGMVDMTPVMITKWVKLSKEVMKMRGEAFLRYIYDELAYRIAKKVADELIAKIKACGTVSTSTQVGVPVVTATTVGVGTVADALGQLSDEAENPVVMMNKASWSTFKAAQYAGSFDVDPFEGLPVLFNNTIVAASAATTGVPYAIVGDLDHGALFNFPAEEDIEFLVDETTEAHKNLVRIFGTEYVGIGVVAPNAFVKIVK